MDQKAKEMTNVNAVTIDWDQRKAAIEKAMADPQVGDPATYCIGSDRYAMRVYAVATKNKVAVQDLNNGVPMGVPVTYTRRKNGRFVQEGHTMRGSGSLTIGIAEDYRDPSF